MRIWWDNALKAPSRMPVPQYICSVCIYWINSLQDSIFREGEGEERTSSTTFSLNIGPLEEMVFDHVDFIFPVSHTLKTQNQKEEPGKPNIVPIAENSCLVLKVYKGKSTA